MFFRNIKIIDYPGFNKIDLTFDNTNVLFITCEKYDNDLVVFSDFFMFFLMLSSPNSNDYIKSTLDDKITTVSIDFVYKEVNYYYYLEISKKGVFLEELYENNNIIYQNNTFKLNPFLPDPVRTFFECLIVIDLTRENWLNVLMDESIAKCSQDVEYVNVVTDLLLSFNLIQDKDNIRSTGDDIYINGKSIFNSSYNIKVIFSLLPLVIDCIGSNSIMFIHGFDIDIDVKSKVNIINLFVNKDINSFNSQLLFTDDTNYNEYNLILNSQNICQFSDDYNGNYILKN
jgi:hypothetical protein